MELRSPTELLTEIRQITKDTETALADRLNTSQPTVNRILKGNANCRTELFRAILRLHAEVTNDKAPA